MNYILGKWYISKNKNFDDFLKFTHVPWYQRKIAEHSNIDIEIQKLAPNKFTRIVNSLFYNNQENIVINNEFHKHDKVRKKYTISNGMIIVNIKGSRVNWTEKIYYEAPYLVVEYTWKGRYQYEWAKQYFLRY